jgi:TolB-like protein
LVIISRTVREILVAMLRSRSFAVLLPLWVLCAPRAAVAATSSVIVLYFDNNSRDAGFEHLGKGLADMMITDLSSVPGLQVVEREKLEALLSELKLQRSKYFDPKTAQRIGQGVGAEYAVTGSIVSASPDLRLDVRVLRVATGQVVKANQVTGKQDKFFDLYQRLVEQLLQGLVPALAADGASRVKQSLGNNRLDDVRAAASYGNGLELRDRGDLKSASVELQKVVEGSPAFALGRARYQQILKDLYSAKDTRAKETSAAEQTILGHLDRIIGKMYDDAKVRREKSQQNPKPELLYFVVDDYRLWPYRSLRGRLFLKRIADRIDRPVAELLPHVRAYVDNQRKLLDELGAWHKRWRHLYRPQRDSCEDSLCFWEGAAEAAKAMGLTLPFTVPDADVESHQIAQDIAWFTVFGDPPPQSAVQMRKKICFHKAEPALAEASLKLLDGAIAELAANREDYERSWADEETVYVLDEMAMINLALGKSEQALAKLQTILTRFPKSPSFQKTEDKLRAILSGQTKLPGGELLLLRCVDPQ